MKRYTLFILYVCVSLMLQAQTERLSAFIDKDCYVAGERLHVSLRVTDEKLQPLDLSKVAYAELADEEGLVAQGMCWLTNGIGWGDIALPSHLHSGCYMLSVYTRNLLNQGQDRVWRRVISIVNPSLLSQKDRVEYLPAQQQERTNTRVYAPGASVEVALPLGSDMRIQTISVVRNPLQTVLYEAPALETLSLPRYTPEIEGHMVMAKPEGDAQPQDSRVVIVGKASRVFDGSLAGNGLWNYFTSGLTGRLALVVNGYDKQGGAAPMQIVSPYAQLKPTGLPTLQVWADKECLLQRVQGARQEHALTRMLSLDTLEHTVRFLSREPDRLYDMDEYARFSTVKEALLEFVKGIKRGTIAGTHMLFAPMAEEKGYSDLPALVLLDGMPVHDVDELLGYDARRLKYIQIYSGSYYFGSSMTYGVLSFISKKGLLSNFTLDSGSRMLSYEFPQDHPDFLTPCTAETSTVVWNPMVDSRTASFAAPSVAGFYQVILQGIDSSGESFRSISELEVR